MLCFICIYNNYYYTTIYTATTTIIIIITIIIATPITTTTTTTTTPIGRNKIPLLHGINSRPGGGVLQRSDAAELAAAREHRTLPRRCHHASGHLPGGWAYVYCVGFMYSVILFIWVLSLLLQLLLLLL